MRAVGVVDEEGREDTRRRAPPAGLTGQPSRVTGPEGGAFLRGAPPAGPGLAAPADMQFASRG